MEMVLSKMVISLNWINPSVPSLRKRLGSQEARHLVATQEGRRFEPGPRLKGGIA